MNLRICEFCGKEITRTPQTRGDKLRFCNQSCITSWRNKKVALSPTERFWRMINKTDTCWLWLGRPRISFGYGRIQLENRQSVSSHRFSWELHNGPIPQGMSVLHKCDVPQCVRPDHLFLGTQLDNMRDRRSKGR